jgi:hypothetical protein
MGGRKEGGKGSEGGEKGGGPLRQPFRWLAWLHDHLDATLLAYLDTPFHHGGILARK